MTARDPIPPPTSAGSPGVALVTGAARGIGLAIATALTNEGWRVVLADLDGAKAAQAASGLAGASAVALDVRDPEAVEAAVTDVEVRDPLRLIVNNAGVSPAPGSDGLWPLWEWQRLVSVNLMGVVHGVNAAYPRMRDRGRGQILNVASLAGLVPGPALGPYAATKHAVVGLSLGLRADAAPFGVRVSVLCPGWVDTAMLDGVGPDGQPIRDHLHEYGIGEPVPPAQVAAAALDGLRRNLPVVVAPKGARRAWWAQRLAPGLLERRSARVVASVAEAAGSRAAAGAAR
jgi:NAD(P)-dependent dehydrogenase (short-subunit alcohol dehydrogenase family)